MNWGGPAFGRFELSGKGWSDSLAASLDQPGPLEGLTGVSTFAHVGEKSPRLCPLDCNSSLPTSQALDAKASYGDDAFVLRPLILLGNLGQN